MSERAWKIEDASAHRTLEFLQVLLRDFHPRNFAVESWDGTAWPPEANQFCRFTWKIKNSGVLRAVITSSNRQVALAEEYILEDFDILGDMEAVFPLADYLIQKEWTVAEKLHLVRRFPALPAKGADPAHHGVRLRGRQHAPARDRQAIAYHYDLSNDFYALWLDRNMVYSAAYFEHPDEDLDPVQTMKLDSICRKLHLKAGEHLLDIACGWGA
jgi:cyclopropane-fatty-acyl-phospholipid synthase